MGKFLEIVLKYGFFNLKVIIMLLNVINTSLLFKPICLYTIIY